MAALTKLSCAWESSRDPVTMQILIQCSLGWDLRFCPSHRLSGDADAASAPPPLRPATSNFSSEGPGH